MKRVQVKATKGGPLIIGKTALCRCGLSKNKPYCDGGHVKYIKNDLSEHTLEVTYGEGR